MSTPDKHALRALREEMFSAVMADDLPRVRDLVKRGAPIHATRGTKSLLARALELPHSTRASRQRVLQTQVTAFQAAHPCLPRPVSARGQPLARSRRDDPRWGNPYFHHVLTIVRDNGKSHPTIGVCT